KIAAYINACYEDDTLKESLSQHELEELITAFEAVGYNNMKEATVATAKASVKQASETTKNLFQDMKEGDYSAAEEAVDKAKGFAKNLFGNFKQDGER